jgi:hypothetical protein
MNKYQVEIPYSCSTYGYVKGYVYADSQEEANSLVEDVDDLDDIEYVATKTDNTEHYPDDLSIELEEENIPEDDIPSYLRRIIKARPNKLPEYFLNEINLI